MDLLARATAIVGGAMVAMRRPSAPRQPAVGASPAIPPARDQGGLMTLKMPSAHGWQGGRTPVASPGLAVNAFASGLRHPRWIEVLPNGDVLVAEALQEPSTEHQGIIARARHATMRRAGAIGRSANRITLCRDADRDGVAEDCRPYLEGQRQPFGMALVGDTFYVGNTDGIMAFDYAPDGITGPGRRLTTFQPGGHWTRSLLASPDGQRLYCGVGSLTNIADEGMAVEEGRAAIWEVDLTSGAARVFAGGLRNPVGLAWEPVSGALWTVVNERDGIGDETPPDYLTSVRDGAFYGWPYSYWGGTIDDRVPQDAAQVARAVAPDYALGGHTASLGLCWMPAGTLPGFPEGMAIGQHGSWNRSTLSGYRLIFVPFTNGHPSGPPRDILTGFLSDDEKLAYGRPVGVAVGPDGRSLLMADDVGNVIWRVTGA